jgi:hypothetical protein
MARDRVDAGVPSAGIPEATGALQGPEPDEAPKTLAERLVPVVDNLRTLASKFGIRPWRCFLVHGYWTGTRRGDGEFVETSRREIVPVPRVRDLSGITMAVEAHGLNDQGDVVVDKISPRIPEEDLRGRTPDLARPDDPQTSARTAVFFWEMVENRPSRPNPHRRRFFPVSCTLSRDGMEWRVTLRKQDFDRALRGQ